MFDKIVNRKIKTKMLVTNLFFIFLLHSIKAEVVDISLGHLWYYPEYKEWRLEKRFSITVKLVQSHIPP